jgi:maltooligosyltrehalose trehalohydrolase
MPLHRKYPIGAEIIDGKGVHFRVWAPDHRKMDLVLEEGESPRFIPMRIEKKGYFSVFVKEAKPGTLYRYRLSHSNQLCADPASRYQPQGPMESSCVVHPAYPWTDKKWKGVSEGNQVAYELHIGTFTQAGTFEAATKELLYLAHLGITMIEVMPLNEFPGRFGWGYDGVNLFAPYHLYGGPNDVKAFIDRAHALGIAVVLDVVYNHLGPEGNQMISFARDYLTDKYMTEWGQTVNFDNAESRSFFLTNARYWIEEYHFDGLRVDSTDRIYWSTPISILQELTQVVKAAGGKKKTVVIGENEPQETKLLKPYEKGGYGFDMLWNDDFHHTACVRLTGKREAFFTDFLGTPQEFISCLKYGYLYQGQYYSYHNKNRGSLNLNIPHQSLMIFLENHDQIANTGHGHRLHEKSDPGNYKALVALLLLSPNTPLIFQGQEFNSKQPFYYFADHHPALARQIHAGRKETLAIFPRLATAEARQVMPDPGDPLTFTQCKLDFSDREKNQAILTLYRDLINLRKTDPVFKKMQSIKIDGAVLGPDAFLIRYFGEEAGDRLVIINLGSDQILNPAPEPLLVPGAEHNFEILWSSESIVYGGEGTPPINIPHWKLVGHSAIVLKCIS